jgi:hypothetical protein
VKQQHSLIDKKLFDLLTDQNTNNNEINNETLLTGKLKTQTQICEVDEMLNLFCILYFELRIVIVLYSFDELCELKYLIF